MSQTTDVNLPDLQTTASDAPDQSQEPEIKRVATDLEAVFDVAVNVSAVLGKATMEVSNLLKLNRGAVVELDIDGEAPGRLPARFELLPAALWVVAPAAPAP